MTRPPHMSPRSASVFPEGVVENEAPECKGHPAGPRDAMGTTVYCDGSCRKARRAA